MSTRFLQILYAILLVLCFGVQSSIASEYSLLLTLRHTFSTDAITLESLSFSQGAASLDAFGLPNAWSARIANGSGDILGSVPFQPVGPLAGAAPSESETFTLSVPYIAGTHSVEIYTPKNTRALSVPVKSESDLVKTYSENLARQKQILEKTAKKPVWNTLVQKNKYSPPWRTAVGFGGLIILGPLIFLVRRAMRRRTPPPSQ